MTNFITKKSAITTTAILAMGALILSTVPNAAESQSSAPATVEVRQADLVVVKFHADWCGSCRAMGPVMTDLGNKFDGKEILFVTVDLTNQSTTAQAEMLLSSMDLDGLWSSNGGKTGRIYVVNGENQQVLETMTKEQTFKDMTAVLTEHL